MLSRISLFITAWAVSLVSITTLAGESLDEVLSRMQVREVRHLHYTERRQMQLLAHPWQAEGEMFVSPKQMLVAQNSPERRFISLSEGRILYVEPDKQIRREYAMEGRFSNSGVALLMQIFYAGNKPAGLEKNFDLGFSSDHDRWSLTLTPKQGKKTEVNQMIISGEEGAEPDHLQLLFEDGDRTEWTLSLRAKGDTAGDKMDQVLEQMNSSVDPWPGLSGS